MLTQDTKRSSYVYLLVELARQLDEVAEWLRRWTANPLGSPRVGSNPILVEYFLSDINMI